MQLTTTIKLVFTILFILTSFPSLSDEAIWEKNNNIFVKVIDKDDSAYSHPYTLDSSELKSFLSLVTIEGDKALFNDEQVHILAKYLPIGLAKARKQQAVIFSVSKNKSSLAGLITREVFTAGAFYIEDGYAVLRIGDTGKERDYGYEAVYDPTKQGLVKYDFDYGLKDGTKPKRNRLSLLRYADNIESSTFNKLRISLKALSGLPEESNKTQTAANRGSANNLSREDVEKMIAEREALAKEELALLLEKSKLEKVSAQQSDAIEPNQSGTPKTQVMAPRDSVTTQSSIKSLEQRFETLKSLKEKGLISEKEYQAKRKELLDEI